MIHLHNSCHSSTQAICINTLKHISAIASFFSCGSLVMIVMNFLHEHLDCGILSFMDKNVENKLELVGENKINLHFQCVWNVQKIKNYHFSCARNMFPSLSPLSKYFY